MPGAAALPGGPHFTLPPWFRKYRFLLGIYGVALVFGVREFLVSRSSEPFGWLSPQGQELTRIIAALNPQDPETAFLQSMQALAAGNPADFEARLERALSSDMKHNEMMLRFYAQYLIDSGAPWQDINRALNRWRLNHPFAREPITLQLASGPRDDAERALLEQALAQVPWIADAAVVSVDGGPDPLWQARILIRRERAIDVREALHAAAVRFSD